MPSPGYHVTPIPKGELGELSKIREEAAEAWDAYCQDARLMMLVELSDLVGAIEAFRQARGIASRPAPFFRPCEPGTMARITARAFASGRRS